jgi:hypothetical protein
MYTDHPFLSRIWFISLTNELMPSLVVKSSSTCNASFVFVILRTVGIVMGTGKSWEGSFSVKPDLEWCVDVDRESWGNHYKCLPKQSKINEFWNEQNRTCTYIYWELLSSSSSTHGIIQKYVSQVLKSLFNVYMTLFKMMYAAIRSSCNYLEIFATGLSKKWFLITYRTSN